MYINKYFRRFFDCRFSNVQSKANHSSASLLLTKWSLTYLLDFIDMETVYGYGTLFRPNSYDIWHEGPFRSVYSVNGCRRNFREADWTRSPTTCLFKPRRVYLVKLLRKGTSEWFPLLINLFNVVRKRHR